MKAVPVGDFYVSSPFTLSCLCDGVAKGTELAFAIVARRGRDGGHHVRHVEGIRPVFM